MRSMFCSTIKTVRPRWRLSPTMISPISSTMLGCTPSLGSSSSTRSGELTSARAIASISCCPPLSLPLLEERKEAVDGTEVGLRAARIDEGAHLEIVEHRHVREDFAPLWNIADAATRTQIRALTRDIFAAEEDSAGARRQQPYQRSHQCGLADAVPAQYADHFAAMNVDADPLQDIARGVAGAQLCGGKDFACAPAHRHARPR